MTEKKVIESRNLNFFYGYFHALKEVTVDIFEHQVTALIGPSGCGKSTFLRVLNRMSDTIAHTRAVGSIRVLGREIYDPRLDVTELRRDVGMVFQAPNPFPQTVFDNLVFGLRIAGENDPKHQQAVVEESLAAVDLWKDLKDSLHIPATGLSEDFQQRLCIARAIAVKPKILLMDEPCSSLDPLGTQKVEELIFKLKKQFTIVIVTHSMQQAARVSDYTGYMMLGELVEFGKTVQVFRNPVNSRTEDYISGKFG